MLPEAWGRLNDAYASTTALVSQLQEYPNLDGISDDRLDEFLSKSPLANWEKDELKAETKRSDYYIKRIFWHRLSAAQAACREHHVYLKKNGIFVHAEVRDKFSELETLVWEALGEHEINEAHNVVPRMREKRDTMRKRGPELLQGLEREVQGRLWNSQGAAP